MLQGARCCCFVNLLCPLCFRGVLNHGPDVDGAFIADAAFICIYCWQAGMLLACLLLACCLSVGLLLPPAAAGTTTLSIPKIVSEQQCHPVLHWQEAGATVERGKGTRREGRGTRRVQLQRNNTSVRRLAGMKLSMTLSR